MPRKIRELSLAVLFITILGIGEKVCMDKREVQKQRDLLAVKKQSIEVLKNTFADIKKVRIERARYNNIAGFYHIIVILTSIEGRSVTFGYGFIKNDAELSSFTVANERMQKEGKTKNETKVIYSNEEEEAI